MGVAMTIKYSFTRYDTIRIQCNGETLEVPLPPKVTDAITSPGANGSVSQQMGGDKTSDIGRPRVRPSVIGIFTVNDLDEDDLPELFDCSNMDTQAVVALSDIANMSKSNLEQILANEQYRLTGGHNQPYVLDIGIDRNALQLPEQLETLQEALRDQQNGLTGIRLLQMPSE